MGIDLTVKIGGEAGQGIQTVGDLLATVCRDAGLYVMAINDFESRIRGGHSFFQIRISDQPVTAPDHNVHILVALSKDTFEYHKDQMAEGGLIIIDEEGVAENNILPIAITELARKAGGRVMANTVAAGACLSLMGAPFSFLQDILLQRFKHKSQEIADNNIAAGKLGFEAVKDRSFNWSFAWEKSTPKGAVIDGSKAMALGALAADCRLASFYPMSPGTGIMTELASYTDSFPLIVEQAEDEISAVNMIIGASYAGVRAMTATSGGGFCLMTEGIGLAGITETPMVVVNAQRPGPATGLATRTAQADLHFVIRCAQDEFPRFVFAPGTPSEAYEIMIRAFHLADKYQVPVIVLADQYLCDSLFMTEKPLSVPEKIERFIISDDHMKNPAEYNRYALTPSGISPRALPCAGKALVMASGNEHTEDGHLTEDPDIRTRMVDKRNAKIPGMISELNPPQTYYPDSEILLVGWGSTKGAIKESVDILRAEGRDIGALHFADIWPFPCEAAEKALAGAKRFISVELNQSAQFGQLIREQTGLSAAGKVLKYNGRPFYPREIAEKVRNL